MNISNFSCIRFYADLSTFTALVFCTEISNLGICLLTVIAIWRFVISVWHAQTFHLYLQAQHNSQTTLLPGGTVRLRSSYRGNATQQPLMSGPLVAFLQSSSIESHFCQPPQSKSRFNWLQTWSACQKSTLLTKLLLKRTETLWDNCQHRRRPHSTRCSRVPTLKQLTSFVKCLHLIHRNVLVWKILLDIHT